MALAANPLDPDRRAAATARRQHGLLTHAQAAAAGLSQRQIDGRVRSGRWERVARGVYLVAGAPASWRQQAWGAVLACGADAVLSHGTAAAVHGLMAPQPTVAVTVPRTGGSRSQVAIVHRGEVPFVDRLVVDGLPVTSVNRTLVDLACELEHAALSEVLDVALCRKLVSPVSVLAAADRVGGGRRGLSQLRSTLGVWTEGIEPGSVAEVRLLRLLHELGLTQVVTQHEVHDRAGRFVARLDVADPVRRKGLEYDGVEFHGPRAWERDERRFQMLRETGWVVQGVTKLDLLPGEPRLRNLVRNWAAA